MGSGGSKGHESFAVAPSTAHLITAANPAPAGTAPLPAATPAPAGPSLTVPDLAAPPAANLDAASPAPADVPDAAAPRSEPAPPTGRADGGEVTPIPEHLPAGLAVGTPILAGGGDLVDDTVRLIRYHGAAGTGDHEVLIAHVDPDAEGKLLAALATTAPSMTVEVPTQITGRLPADTATKIGERMIDTAKNVNRSWKKGTEIPATAAETAAQLKTELEAIAGDSSRPPADLEMAGYYLGHLQQIQQRLDTPLTARAPYSSPGGKVPNVTAFETTATVMVTETVPDPSQIPLGQLPTSTGPASRIRATFDPDTGQASWNAAARSKATGREYLIDLGDGYTARYRPHQAIDGAPAAASQRGCLEITGPAGAGHSAQLVDKMATLNLGNRPLTGAEAEWTYLRRQVVAQDLRSHPQVAAAHADAAGLDAAMQQVLMAQRAHQAIGLDEEGLHRFAARLESDAAHAALPAKVKLLREAVAHATGHADGAALAAQPSYQPTPQAAGGWLTWSRFDVVGNPAVAAALNGKRLRHNIHSPDHLVSMYRTGVLACTERRAEMGLPTGLGSSEHADQNTGGAQSVFCRITSKGGGGGGAGVRLLWNDPATLLRRADWYAYNGDHYGALDPSTHQHSQALTRDPLTVAAFTASNNEIMFRNGIDLLGPEGPDHVRCGSDAHRTQILDILAEKGITHLKGVPVAKVITT